MTGHAFFQAALALAAGMSAQLAAARIGVPSIVCLLAAGVLLGPDVLGIVDPDAFGSGLNDLVALAVTVILFEGGLALDLARLRAQQRPLLLLLTLGAAISMVGGTLAARYVLGLSWAIASLYGALMIVTGPTVVTPLVSHMTLDRPVRELLVSEGVLIDPLGAIVALVAADYVTGESAMLESGWLVLLRLGVGGTIGVAAGLGVALALRRRWLPEDLVNPVVLGSVILAAALASRLSAEAGLMAAVTQGVALGNRGVPELRRLRDFKEALTVVLLSLVFVVLAAGLRFDALRALGWGGIAVVALLAWVVRPIAVFASTVGSVLTLPQRAFVAWICPRGIVAAAVASLFAILLGQAGIPGGSDLEALTFVTVAFTVAVQGITARAVAHALGVDVPTVRGTIVVGADRLGRLLARLLADLARQVVLVDKSPAFCRAARAEGFSVYEGDALSVYTLEEAGASYADTVVALTRNPELNALVSQRVRDNFRVEHVLGLVGGDGETAKASLFPGNFAGIDEVNQLLAEGRFRIAEYAAADGHGAGLALAELPWGVGEFGLLTKRGDGVMIATPDARLEAGDHLWCARPAAEPSGIAALLAATAPADASAAG